MTVPQLKDLLHQYSALNKEYYVRQGGLDLLNPDQTNSGTFTDYHNQRLSWVSFFADLLQLDQEDSRCVFIAAVNLMDRYMITKLKSAERPGEVMASTINIRAACLCLAVKMYGPNMDICGKDLCNQSWVNRALVREDTELLRPGSVNLYAIPTIKNMQDAEFDIIITLKGELFPIKLETTVDVLCKILIPKYLFAPTLVHKLNLFNNIIDGSVKRAMDLYGKRLLETELLQFDEWKCIIACCILAVIQCSKEDKEKEVDQHVHSQLLLSELHVDGFTSTELSVILSLLSTDCLVCKRVCVRKSVKKALLKVSSSYCEKCRANLSEI